jgi:hypothetical protein
LHPEGFLLLLFSSAFAEVPVESVIPPLPIGPWLTTGDRNFSSRPELSHELKAIQSDTIMMQDNMICLSIILFSGLDLTMVQSCTCRG